MPGAHSSNSLYCVEHCRSLNAQHFLFCCVIFFVPRHVVFRNARSFSLSLFGNRIYERKNEKKKMLRDRCCCLLRPFSLFLYPTQIVLQQAAHVQLRGSDENCLFIVLIQHFWSFLMLTWKNENLILCFNEKWRWWRSRKKKSCEVWCAVVMSVFLDICNTCQRFMNINRAY